MISLTIELIILITKLIKLIILIDKIKKCYIIIVKVKGGIDLKKKLLGACPVCGGGLQVTELSCKVCETKISGKFSLSKFDCLSSELQEFALIFIKNAGNIKGVEKDLGVSYPTVKKNLAELIKNLGYESNAILPEEKMTKEEILSALRRKEIDFDEAQKLFKELK